MLVRADFERYIDENAAKHGVNPATMKAIIDCETGGTWEPAIQSKHVRNGKREQSFGLVQIHAPSHPDISYEEMIDPTFALDYLMENWGEDYWSCQELI